MSLSTLSRLLARPLLVLVLSAPVVILLLAVQGGPGVSAVQPLTSVEISRIEQLLLESAPPAPTHAGMQELRLNADELNLLLHYSIDVMNLSPGWAANLIIDEATLNAEVSVALTGGWMPLFLNIRADFIVNHDSLELASLTVGHIQIPDRFLQYALAQVGDELQSSSGAFQDFSALVENIESVDINADRMIVALHWDPALISRIADQAQQLFISEPDRQRIIAHYQQIAEIAATIPADLRAVSLKTFLIPLFAVAHEKSQNGSDPRAENRTLFQTLAIYVNELDIAQLVGEESGRQLAPAKFIEVRLQRRQDLARHLTFSAAITASAGADFAAMLATTKEAYDARYRSGFSFSDLTANTVGVTLASFATRDRRTALLMQERMANLQDESDYMPAVENNRDGLSETDFNAIYSDRNSPEYQSRLLEIQELIMARPIFQGL